MLCVCERIGDSIEHLLLHYPVATGMCGLSCLSQIYCVMPLLEGHVDNMARQKNIGWSCKSYICYQTDIFEVLVHLDVCALDNIPASSFLDFLLYLIM